jgi:hypothetical protein
MAIMAMSFSWFEFSPFLAIASISINPHISFHGQNYKPFARN